MAQAAVEGACNGPHGYHNVSHGYHTTGSNNNNISQNNNNTISQKKKNNNSNNNNVSQFPLQYKTRPCKFYTLGMCTRGTECTFLHPSDRPGGKMGPQAVQLFAASAIHNGGLPTVDAQGNVVFISSPPPAYDVSRFKYKTEVCKFFSDAKCRKGAQCSFIHPGVDPFVPYRVKPCLFFERGCCKRGADCTFRHDGAGGSKSQQRGSQLPMKQAPAVAPVLAPPAPLHFLQQQQEPQLVDARVA
eukprot:g55500.t1